MVKKRFIRELPHKNLENGMPSLADATRSMAQFINESKHAQQRVIKIIHGYGSSGVGGKLRVGLRQELAARSRSGKIKGFIPGERFGRYEETQPYLNQYSQLAVDPDFDRGNAGITIIILF
ncbi:MAG: Smr/MutS family protein [Chloroflexi bacterium]|nr:Smr/MutS family protein [Chloroflexota bacterium]